MSDWLGKLSAFLPGADQMSEADRMALLRQGLLAAGLGILKNNQGNYGKAGPAIGAGVSEGLLAMNKGAGDLSDRKFKQRAMEQQLGDPAGFRTLDLMAQAAGHKPGTPGYEAFFKRANGEIARQSSAAIQYKEVEGPDGRTRIVAMDPREIGAQVVGDGAGYGSFQIDPSLPPEVQEAIRQSEANGQPLPQHIDLAPAVQRPSASAGMNPFVSRRPEDDAAAIAAAQKAVELQALPTELGLRTNAAIDQAGGVAQVQVGVDRAESDRLKSQAMAQYEAARDGLVTGLSGTNTGPIAGRLPAITEGQQIAEGSVAAMAPVLKQLFRASGEGVFTDRDQALLMEMLPRRTDLPAAAQAKLRNIDAIVKAKLGSAAPSGVRRYNPATGKIE